MICQEFKDALCILVAGWGMVACVAHWMGAF